MFKNYFILNRLIIELNSELKGYRIIRAFSFEKDKIILVLQKLADELIIEISVNPGFPYLNLKKKVSIPKRNLIDFFAPHFPLTINLFEIAENDRIIRIKTQNASIYFTIRGKYTNVYIIDDKSEIKSFKKVDDQILIDIKQEIHSSRFISEFKNLTLDNVEDDLLVIRKKYPIIGKEIINEAAGRSKNRGDNFNYILKNVIDEIKTIKPAIFIDESSGEVNLGIESYTVFPFTKIVRFINLIEALNHFIIEKFTSENAVHKKKIIEKYLERELSKVSGKLNDVSNHIKRGSKEDELNKSANLLLVNINSIKKGEDKIQLQDMYNENIPVSIKLDPRLSPKQNVDAYFNKARNEKIKLSESKRLFSELTEKFSELNKIKKRFISAESADELNTIMKELKINREEKKKQGDDLKSKFKHYVILDKYNVYVGKDSKNNDLLTMKFAKPNDYWFHARSVSGSHVVLKNENPKEGIPKNILKITASLAAYHSKAKTSGMAPVSYTQKKYVSKRKGMEPGKVALTKEEVLIVRPEIPKECKYEV